MSESASHPDSQQSRLRIHPSLLPETAPALQHAPTWELQLGAHGTGYGELDKQGFAARNSNHSSGQDAFAVSADHRRFAVADGLGASTDPEGTAFLAKFLADAAVVQGVDALFDDTQLLELYSKAEDAFEAESGRRFHRSNLRTALAGSVATTLTYAEVVSPHHVRIVTIGDSPAFRLNRFHEVIDQFGEDAQSGSTDNPLAFKLGLDRQGAPFPTPKRDEVIDGKRIVDKVVNVLAGGVVAIGTDYFSETPKLQEFTGLTPKAFHALTLSSGKADDSTLIVVNPSKVAA